MSVYLLFLIVGLGLGALYAALALGLVIVYKGTGVINFAQGAMAMWAAFVYDEVRKSGDLVFVFGRVHVGRATGPCHHARGGIERCDRPDLPSRSVSTIAAGPGPGEGGRFTRASW